MRTDYRQNTWTLREARSTFERQMADHARGELLRQLRSERSLSQEDVAHALGVTTKTYGDWERGGGIQPANARKVARYFKVKPGTLITPEIPPAPSPNGDGPHLSPELQEQLDRIEEKLDEILRRLDDGPASDDEGPTREFLDLADGGEGREPPRRTRGQTQKRRRAR